MLAPVRPRMQAAGLQRRRLQIRLLLPTRKPAHFPVHPVRNPRFASFRTQPLENLSAAVKLPIKKRFLGNPTLGTNLG